MSTDWSRLREDELARLRYSIISDMARIERGEFSMRHWGREHALLLEIKQTTRTKEDELEQREEGRQT